MGSSLVGSNAPRNPLTRVAVIACAAAVCAGCQQLLDLDDAVVEGGGAATPWAPPAVVAVDAVAVDADAPEVSEGDVATIPDAPDVAEGGSDP